MPNRVTTLNPYKSGLEWTFEALPASSACQKTEYSVKSYTGYSVKKLNSVVRHAVDSSSILLLLSVPLDINNRIFSQGAKSSPPILPLGLHALEYDKSALFHPLLSLQARQSTLQLQV